MWVDVGSRCPAVLQTCRSFKGLSSGAGVGGGGVGRRGILKISSDEDDRMGAEIKTPKNP